MKHLAVIVVIALTLGACSRQDPPELTTTTTTSPTTAPETTTTTAEDSTSTTTAPTIESYEVVIKSSTDGGQVLWVVVPPGEYSSVAVESLLARVIEETGGPIWEVHVFSDPEALEAARIPAEDRTEAESELVANHYLISLIEGNTVRFQGPFADLGEYVYGS